MMRGVGGEVVPLYTSVEGGLRQTSVPGVAEMEKVLDITAISASSWAGYVCCSGSGNVHLGKFDDRADRKTSEWTM